MKGNAAFVRGPSFYGVALRHYHECIDHAFRIGVLGKGASDSDRPAQVGDRKALLAAAWANIAAIHLARRKYVSCVDAAQAALRESGGSHVKACYRAAQVRRRCWRVGGGAPGA